jgi:hypothetical protein
MRRALTDEERHKIAGKIVEHLESTNWKIEKGPPAKGHGQQSHLTTETFMFSQPIVFVIGAGASAEFKMPVGAELKKRIAQTLNFTKGPHGGDVRFYQLIASRFPASSHVKAAAELSRIIGQFDSIDEALNWFSDPDLIDIGKSAIVWEILKAERASQLYNPDNPNFIPRASSNEAWIEQFLSMAVSAVKKDNVWDVFSNVKFINFNYDRTLEHYLYSELQHKFELSELDATRAISQLQIIRPYGVVGPLPWQKEQINRVAFGCDLSNDFDQLWDITERVRTYTEQIITTELHDSVTQAIDNAKQVVFLGFWYHQQNMRLIRPRGPGSRYVLATVLGMDHNNHNRMAEMLRLGLATTREPQLLLMTCRDLLLRMKPSLISEN